MITHVAIRFQDKLWSLPRPYRHHHIIRVIMYLDGKFGDGELTSVDTHDKDQGFLDHTGAYLDREQALKHAMACGQVVKGKWGEHLYSEDVW
jgi:hypothetical protein